MANYTLPELDYDYSALAPHISATIMELHHSKHHKAYVDGANTALEKLAEEDSSYPKQKIREGIVVKLEYGERFDSRHGRVALKYVSDRYLCMK